MLQNICEMTNGLRQKKKPPLRAQAYIICRGLEEFMAAREQLDSPTAPIGARAAQDRLGLIPRETLNLFSCITAKAFPVQKVSFEGWLVHSAILP